MLNPLLKPLIEVLISIIVFLICRNSIGSFSNLWADSDDLQFGILTIVFKYFFFKCIKHT